MKKKAALELSVGTIVILVLAMAMLILGIVLVRNIFTGAGDAVELINDNVKAQINALFNEDDSKKMEIYLPNHEAKVSPGKNYIVRFAVKNVLQDVSGSTEFKYETDVNEIESGCPITVNKANDFIKIGRRGSLAVAPGQDPKEGLLRIEIPEGTALCSLSYSIKVTSSGQFYDQDTFLLTIE